MTKELEKEYLEDLDHYDEGMGIHSTSYEKCKERLIRLAKIDNSNPSEAMKCLDKIVDKGRINDGSCCHWKECLSKNKCNFNNDNLMCPDYTRANTIKQALQHLEAIKNANPSEALELIGYLKDHHLNAIPYYDWLNDIEKYILKAQEQEKVLKIIFEKGLPLAERDMIKHSENYEQYCIKCSWCKMKNTSIQKTQEEFDLLKRYCNE